MAIVAKLKASGSHVIVIGTGYGAFESARASRILGDLLPAYQRGRIGMVAVATKDGEISWCPSHELEVVEIDGVAVGDALREFDAVESVDELDFPAATADEVRCHPQYPAFVREDRERQFLTDDRMELEFAEWQSKKYRKDADGG